MAWTKENWQAAEAEWRRDGFLSGAAVKAESAITRTHAEWFEHAEQFNRVGQAAFFEGSPAIAGQSTHDPLPVACRMTLRALSTFQGVILLSRRGMAVEGFTLARNLYEIAFWVSYLAVDGETAAKDFLRDEQLSRLGALKLDRECHYSGEITLALKDLAKIERDIRGFPKGKGLNLKQLAKRANLLGHYRTYKMVSMRYAHASLGSLYSLLQQLPDGTVKGHLFGPDEDLSLETLQCATIAFGICLIGFSQMVGCTSMNNELQRLLVQTDELRGITLSPANSS
jgi:uncharacterized protein DUF5677